MTNTNPLLNLFNGYPSAGNANSTPAVLPQTQTLPNSGGTYNPAAPVTQPIINPPVFTGSKTASKTAPKVVASKATAPAASSGWVPAPGVNYDKYKDPATGKIMSPTEYAAYLASKIPQGNGDIPTYAGNAMTNPNQTANQLNTQATNLNNNRNDIATGTTDPYKAGNQSGIAYSPTELKAIENAYAGIYDPALNDVFSRLKDKEASDKSAADLKQAEAKTVFDTNEAIRQWRATTGIKALGGNTSGLTSTPTGGKTGTTKSTFTANQTHNGASNAGMDIATFSSLDPDIQNFYINPPTKTDSVTGKKTPIYKNFAEDIASVTAGKMDGKTFSSVIASSLLPAAVKTYFINKIPNVPAPEKESWISQIWNSLMGN